MTGGAITAVSAPSRPDPSDESLEALTVRLQERREGALEALIARTQGACSRLAMSILQDAELSRDALQEAYFLVYQRIGQLREPAALKSWLFRIVNHCCHDIRRARARQPETPLPADQKASGDVSQAVDQQQAIRATFEQLPDIDRTALALREVCSMSYEEMSQVLNVPLGTVRSRPAKARKRFIDAYQGGA
jgi:RNA polymerase sigma-70 factor (ECF subfamily)